ncbi:hypothetical protein P8452_44719 [Trifolium repens]|nr:hypothetical protein P8452_44719 [Trifolium repens]
MQRSVCYYAIFLLLNQILCSGSSRTEKEAPRHVNVLLRYEVKQESKTIQKDITTPITIIPTISTPEPFYNPNSNPDTVSPTSTLPYTNPNTLNTSPISSGSSWCVASPSASQIGLQVALDYACGYGGIDCSAIQPDGSCYIPNFIHDHASYAFNKYYHKNPVPNSCNFGGTAVITSTNPSKAFLIIIFIATFSLMLIATLYLIQKYGHVT